MKLLVLSPLLMVLGSEAMTAMTPEVDIDGCGSDEDPPPKRTRTTDDSDGPPAQVERPGEVAHERTCVHCGLHNVVSAIFCNMCGTALPSMPPTHEDRAVADEIAEGIALGQVAEALADAVVDDENLAGVAEALVVAGVQDFSEEVILNLPLLPRNETDENEVMQDADAGGVAAQGTQTALAGSASVFSSSSSSSSSAVLDGPNRVGGRGSVETISVNPMHVNPLSPLAQRYMMSATASRHPRALLDGLAFQISPMPETWPEAPCHHVCKCCGSWLQQVYTTNAEGKISVVYEPRIRPPPTQAEHDRAQQQLDRGSSRLRQERASHQRDVEDLSSTLISSRRARAALVQAYRAISNERDAAARAGGSTEPGGGSTEPGGGSTGPGSGSTEPGVEPGGGSSDGSG